MTPHTFWNELTVEEWWSCYDEWSKMEKVRLGIPLDGSKSEPLTIDEFEKLKQADADMQRRVKRRELANADSSGNFTENQC